MSKKNLLKKVKGGRKVGFDGSNDEDGEEGEGLHRWPEIPGGTMTGMRTFIRGGTRSESRFSAPSPIESYGSGSGYGYGRSQDNANQN